uniref:Uncharacterized protein n=1 Tax=viral metagenome TaxID=1070528 RepID=A0A6C0EIW2_9ZZZZ
MLLNPCLLYQLCPSVNILYIAKFILQLLLYGFIIVEASTNSTCLRLSSLPIFIKFLSIKLPIPFERFYIFSSSLNIHPLIPSIFIISLLNNNCTHGSDESYTVDIDTYVLSSFGNTVYHIL